MLRILEKNHVGFETGSKTNCKEGSGSEKNNSVSITLPSPPPHHYVCTFRVLSEVKEAKRKSWENHIRSLLLLLYDI
jgi:hypothetical protein